jgi:hypothetical protein
VRLLGDADEFRVVSLHEFDICIDRRSGMIESVFNTPLYRGSVAVNRRGGALIETEMLTPKAEAPLLFVRVSSRDAS